MFSIISHFKDEELFEYEGVVVSLMLHQKKYTSAFIKRKRPPPRHP